MATLDFTAPRVDLRIKAGMDAVFTCTADSSIAGWSGFTAKVVYPDGTEVSLGVDTSAQASQQITLNLTDAQTSVIPVGSRWQFWATDASGDLRPLAKGSVQVEEDYTA